MNHTAGSFGAPSQAATDAAANQGGETTVVNRLADLTVEHGPLVAAQVLFAGLDAAKAAPLIPKQVG